MGVEPRWTGLQETAQRLGALLDVKRMGELARYIQASREAGRFVAVGGEEAALALYEARGDVARARPLMSRARRGAAGTGGGEAGPGKVSASQVTKPPGSLAALVDLEVGHTPEVVEAKLAAVESEAQGPRLPRNVAVLERQRPSLEAPPPGARGNPRWSEYVGYYEKRLGEVKEGKAAKGPLAGRPMSRCEGGSPGDWPSSAPW